MYIFNHYINNRVLRILLIALLIFCMVFGAFMVQYSYADLVLVPAIAVCATLLVACGVMSATDTDLQAVATAFHNSLAGQALTDVQTIAMEYGLVGSDKFTFKATKAVVNAVADWFAAQDWSGFEAVGNTFLGGFTISGLTNATFQGIDCSNLYNSNWTYFDLMHDIFVHGNSGDYASTIIPLVNLTSFPLLNKILFVCTNAGSSLYITYKIINNQLVEYWCDANGNLSDVSHVVTNLMIVHEPDWAGGWREYSINYCYYEGATWQWAMYGFPLSYSGTEGSVTTFPDTNVKSDTTYFPKEVVDVAGGTTTFPSNTASKPLTTETPLTIPQTGVNSTTMPGDVRTDADSPPIDVPLDTPGWLSKIWDGVCAIPDAIAGGVTAIVDAVGDAIGSIADALSNFFNPSEFKLDFSKFKVGLTEVFPFCIPFDFVKAIKLLATDSSGFSFDIDLKTTWFTIDHTVDLKPFKIPILFFRFICDFWFGYILISRTRDWIKW